MEVLLMSGQEYMSVKEAMDEVREGQRELLQCFNDFKTYISDNYVKKDELETSNDKNYNSHNNMRNWIIGTYGFVAAVGAIIIGFFQWKGVK